MRKRERDKKAGLANGHRLQAGLIVLIVCGCGWFIMELEVLGVRALAPYFGSAVYVVMGSVIGVFLLGLSAGYLLGGWLSRKAKGKLAIGINLIVAGMWLCAVPFFIEHVCDGIFNLGLDEKWGSLMASVVLFGVPIVLLGTVSPAAVQWLTTQASDSGFNTGVVLALSTAASFAGCIVTAFYLVLFSLRNTIFVSGIILAVMGGIVLMQSAVSARGKTKCAKQP